jgi:CRP/FNR family cyclic AMP-dependent transcriptional regulator
MKEVASVTSIASDDPCVTTLFKNISDNRHVVSARGGETIFSQGDSADSVYFIQSGSVKISLVSYAGKEGVLAIMGPHGFFGEESLAGKSLRTNTATTMEPSAVLQVERRAMVRALHAHSDLAEVFMAFLLKRRINLEEDLADQLFNHSEKRLARVLLKLAQLGERGAVPDTTIPKLSHETLAEMVGTTRSRITHFMNKFRRMHLIEYGGHSCDRGFGVIVRTERLTDVVLQD